MEIKEYLNSTKPDAIFASDDLTAILVIKIAQELGISVPEELKVIGYDGTYFIENYYPQLATIKQPLEEIACLTVDLLLQKIEGKGSRDNRLLFYQLHYCPEKVFIYSIENQKIQTTSYPYLSTAGRLPGVLIFRNNTRKLRPIRLSFFMILNFLDSAGLSLG